MNHTQSLPEPTADTLSHSKKLVNVIRQEIQQSHTQSIPFRRYMEMALYYPTLGYYVAGTHKIGEQGDFVTAPEISPLFSQCIASQCADILLKLNADSDHKNKDALDTLDTLDTLKNSILELGAGSGRMACDMLLSLEQQKALPNRYYILDLSPDLIQRQQQTIQNNAPHLLHLVEWIHQLPQSFNGIIIGNEVVDAMPVDVFTQQGDEVYEHHVIWQDDTLVEQLKLANDTLKQRVTDLSISPSKPYTSEINPNLNAWMNTLSDCLAKGVILLIDYGYTRSEYYHAERNKGTLICHYQHLVNDSPLTYPGLQDITANVDFTAIAEAADNAGLLVSGFTTQAHLLANLSMEHHFAEALAQQKPDHQDHAFRLAQQVKILSLPSEMGERFKAIALSKNMSKNTGENKSDEALLGFLHFDQRYRL